MAHFSRRSSLFQFALLPVLLAGAAPAADEQSALLAQAPVAPASPQNDGETILSSSTTPTMNGVCGVPANEYIDATQFSFIYRW